MVREVLTINVGQCGVQMGSRIWHQYCAEHGIQKDGHMAKETEDNHFQCFFEETGSGQFVPRTLMVDLEPNVVDDVRNGAFSAIYDPHFLLSGKEDAANMFGRGFYTVGKGMMDKVNDRLRKMADNCDNLQGFIMNHSVGGGTGSGLGALILERCAVDYRKKTKVGFEVYPSPNISNCVVEPINAISATHWLCDHTEVSVILDNEALYEICQKNLDIAHPSYDNINRLIAKAVSSVTASLRFGGELNSDLRDLQTNMVPFPRLHFMITAMAPVAPPQKSDTINLQVQHLTDACFSRHSFLTKIADFDAEEDKYMAASLMYRGEVRAKEASDAVQWLKSNRKAAFVEWMPTGFKVGLTATPAAKVEDDDADLFDRNVVMLANNTAVSRVFTERIAKKFDLMYAQRAFIWWFVGEGYESGEFAETREDLGFLEKDYLDVLSEQATDEWDDSDEGGYGGGYSSGW